MQFKKQLLAVAITSLVSSSAWATNGYAPHGVGQKSKGMGGVGVAYTQDTLAGGINPAGMVHQGNSMDLGIELFRPIRKTTISGTPGGFSDGTFDSDGKRHFLVPEFGYNHMINNDMSFGVSVFGTGGMNTTYKGGIPLFNGTGSNVGIDLAQLFVVPTLAYKINENHSVGIGLNLAAQRFQASGLANFAGSSSDAAHLTDNGKDYSYGVGLRLGWMGKVSDTVTLGATYQTKTRMSEFDDYAGLFAEQGDFDIPENYALGIALQATPKLTVAFDIMRINYSGVNSVGNPLANLLSGNPLGSSNGPGFGWEDQTNYKLGIAYDYSDKLTLRAGWNHGDAPIPNSQTMFNILAPATVEDHLTLGASWKLDDGMEVTATYMHAFENKITGPGSVPAGFGGGNADIQMYQDSFGVGFSWDM
ncbi:MAG: long-chain fatty acid transporter [Sedimenticola thiotaurini]|uniref:Long-chain fatty acid transporter n=1 Tax=Sedimenticola thiotaurini TaxID=1543721 RepID=A0A558DEM4_9GAMM|nr:MAG: long-chain fatty acid transporter [Sedimenticola thiotaurini]